MKKEFDIPEALLKDMAKFTKVDWNKIVAQAIEGCIHDFSILDRLKEFWGVERKKAE